MYLKLKTFIFIFIAITFCISNSYASKAVRIKDLVTIKGVRENPIIGYGIVIGLKGTGDSGGEITSTSMKKMLQSLGLNPKAEVVSKNVAAVVVTGKLPAFPRVGQFLDVTISSIGDASSLAGGTLVVTPLKAGDGQVYAVAQGQVSIGGLEKGSKITTNGRIPNGATVEKELATEFNSKQALRLALKQPDFTTSARIAKTINTELGGKFATAKDSGTIDLIIPNYYERNVVELLGIVENFSVIPDQTAKIIINEKTGTVVAGGNIVIKSVAISHKDMVLKVDGDDAKSTNTHSMPETSTIDELVKVLNSLGATPDDLISIFQALQKNGALSAEIELI